MAMVVNHNIPALTTYNTVNRTNSALEKSIQKLSTGLRINSAADDAAGLAISEKMRAQVNGMDRAVSNAQDGISMIQVAEGALNETHSILQRMRELAVQASNDTLTSQDRSYIQLEIDELRDEVTRIGNTTQFNKKKLLNGDAAVLWSSDNLETKAVVNGGLRSIDQFGQKVTTEGNYRIKVTANSGQGEVQKSDIFRIKHDVNPWYAKIDSTKGVAAVEKQKAPEIKGGGIYSVRADIGDDITAATNLVSQVGAVKFETEPTIPNTFKDNAILKFTVTDVNNTTGSESVTFKVAKQVMGKDGNWEDGGEQTITYATGALSQNVTVAGTDLAFAYTTDIANIASRTQKGDEMIYNIIPKGTADDGDFLVTVKGSPESGNMVDHQYVVNKNQVKDKSLEFKMSYVESDPKNPDLKEIQEGSVYLQTNKRFTDNVSTGTLATYYKNVNVPADSDPEWLSTLDTTIKSATISDNFPKDGAFAVEAQKLTAKDGSWNTLSATGTDYLDKGLISLDGADSIDASGILELTVGTVSEAAGTAGTVTLTGKFYGTKTDGTGTDDGGEAVGPITLGNTQVGTGADVTTTGSAGANLGKLKLGAISSLVTGAGQFKAGDKIYIQVGAKQAAGDVALTVNGKNGDGNSVFSGYSPRVVIASASLTEDTEYQLKGLVFNKDGEAIDFGSDLLNADRVGQISLTASALVNADDMHGKTVASFTYDADNPAKIKSSIGEIGSSSTKLYDLEKFWDSQGVFMLKEPQTLTLTQGDGKQATVTLYETDTLGSMAEKINNAIANDLGQAKYVDDASKFATYVDKGTEENTSESVTGTMLIRTVVPGSQGTIRFSGNEDIINALSLNTIQSAEESTYTVNIEDAHSGKKIVTDAKVTGNKLVGALHPNVDVVFDATAGISAKWDNEAKKYEMEFSETPTETVLHLTDNTTVFQIGANEGEDMGIHIGDMRAEALGLNRVLVTDRESASHSITLIDNAIDKVSTQRAKLGAYQNRLEHTVNNLNTASENITAAESRIRDTDMAKEMMNFTKLQIMLQAGTSMLAQANQLPQNVLSLVR